MLIYMSTYDAPDFVVNIYNPSFFASDTATGLTQASATALFLTKNSPDTATALTTFGGGLATNAIGTTTLSSNQNIGTASNTGTLVIDTQGNTTIGASQVGGTLAIGGATTRTGAITIGSAGNAILPITIGSTSATATTTIRNPRMVMSYTAQPTLTNVNIGFTDTVYLNSLGGNNVTLVSEQAPLSFTSVPVGIWYISYSLRVAATSTTVTSSVTNFQSNINISAQGTSVPDTYAISSILSTQVAPVFSSGVTASFVSTNGSVIVKLTASATIQLRVIANAGTAISYWNLGIAPIVPYNYLSITRIA